MLLLDVLLIAAALYVATILFKFSKSLNSLAFGLLAAASFTFVVIQSSVLLQETAEHNIFSTIAGFTTEWGHLLILSLIFSALAVKIRDAKPTFAQFPKSYAALPVLIIISYLLVKDTFALKAWLLSIYQGGAIFISLLLYSVNTYRDRKYQYVLIGVAVIFFSYISFWYVPFLQETFQHAWQILLAIGMLLFVYGYQQVHQPREAIV